MQKLVLKKLFKCTGYLAVVALLLFNYSLSVVSSFEEHVPQVNNKIKDGTQLPDFTSPVALLVGLNSSDLSYRELSNLVGYELFSVPSRSNVQEIISQIQPTQVIIKHQSGFVGLYTPSGELIRGVQTIYGDQTANLNQTVPQSILQPQEANPLYDNVYYPGSAVGTVPYGGLSYDTRPKGKSIFRNLLKFLSFTYVTPPVPYPGFFNTDNFTNGTLPVNPPLGAVLLPTVPAAINAGSSYLDTRFDGIEYDQARSQPRDYMFQPVIESY